MNYTSEEAKMPSNATSRLLNPANLSIAQIVDKISRHHSVPASGASRLPVLAMHAILSILARETDRYRNCTVLPFEQHSAADARTNLAGDIKSLTPMARHLKATKSSTTSVSLQS